LEEDEVKPGMNRREFMRRAAITGAAAAWAAPAIQTLTARPAFASTGTPVECHHSFGPWFTNGVQQCDTGGCMQACKAAAGCQDECGSVSSTAADACQQVCDQACPNVAGSNERQCCDGSFCDSANWTLNQCGGPGQQACYVGSASCNGISQGFCATK
jgi:hypothetical protein